MEKYLFNNQNKNQDKNQDNNLKLSLTICVTFVLLLMVTVFPTMAADTPLTVIKKSNTGVQSILKTKKTLDKPTEDKLLVEINKVTNFAAIAQRVTKRFCKDLKPEQCKQFDAVFQELLRASSLKKMGRYRADKFDYLGEEVTGQTAIVKTIAYYKEEQAELNYHLEKVKDTWQIVNYVVDDIDTVRNYKKQFNRLFKKLSFEKVIQRLKKKIASYQEENRS